MATRILLAAILCLSPAFAAAQADTGRPRDIAEIHHLIEQYAKAVDTVNLNLLSQIWSHSPDASFIYPLGEEHGFDAIEHQVFQNVMGGMFSARDLETHGEESRSVWSGNPLVSRLILLNWARVGSLAPVACELRWLQLMTLFTQKRVPMTSTSKTWIYMRSPSA